MRIFLLEDNELYARRLEYHLALNPENEVRRFSNANSFLAHLHEAPDCVLLDYGLPDKSGTEVLKLIKEYDAELPVLIVSGQEDVSTAVDLLREGAYDYIVKDDNTQDKIWKAINNLRETVSMRKELSELRAELSTRYDFQKIMGLSEEIQKVHKLIAKAAQTNISVSIIGETGTGKELVAKAIHYNSPNSKRPLVSINLSAIPSDLIEGELFGHEAGAFTGAHNRRIGKFEEANGGTLFLDEIGELDLNIQAKLLRVLQEREIYRLGSNKPIKINCRVIVATHRNLAQEVREGHFREDLYYRILGMPIELPPLRKRGADKLLLAKHFLSTFTKENRLPGLKLSKAAQERIMAYPWPGNVRELKAVIELACVLAEKGIIEEKDLNYNSVSDEMDNLVDEGLSLKEYNRRIIQHYLKKYQNNVVQVAQKLEVGKSTLYRMIKNKELNIN